MEKAIINGKEYTKEEVIQIGKEHFEAAIRLRKYGIFLTALGLGFLTVSLVFFLLISNSLIEFDDWASGLGAYYTTLVGLFASGICLLIGLLSLFLSFTKSDEQEYIKAGVIYLNKQANK